MTNEQVLQVFAETNALLEGHFLLRSGLHSRQFFQCAQVLQWPVHTARLCAALAEQIKDLGATTVISPAMGGLFVGHEVARSLRLRHIFAEKNKEGNLELRRNFQIGQGERLLVVEDVITRGGRVQETIDIVTKHGGTVAGVGVLVDRSGGTVDFGVPLKSLLRLQVETFEPSNCPLCKAGQPVVKPGS